MKRFISVPGALLVLHMAVAPQIPAFSAISFIQNAEASAAFNPYLRGMSLPGQLADAIQAAHDRSGDDKYIDPKKCMDDGSCATPNAYLTTFNAHKAKHGEPLLASVPDMIAWLRTLKPTVAPAGVKYKIAGLTFSSHLGPNVHWQTNPEALSRKFGDHEGAWMDPVTHRIVLAQDCGNPVDQPEDQQEACVYIRFYNKPDGNGKLLYTSGRIGGFGPTDLSKDISSCSPALMRPGETVWESLGLLHECDNFWCDFSGARRKIPEPLQFTSSFSMSKAGEYVVRGPLSMAVRPQAGSEYRTAFCFDQTTDPGPSPEKFRDLVGTAEELKAESVGLLTAYGRIIAPDMYNQPALVRGVNDSAEARELNDRINSYDKDAAVWNQHAKEWNALHSCGTQVRWFDFLPRPGGRKVATFYATKEDAQRANDVDVLNRPRQANWVNMDRIDCED